MVQDHQKEGRNGTKCLHCWEPDIGHHQHNKHPMSSLLCKTSLLIYNHASCKISNEVMYGVLINRSSTATLEQGKLGMDTNWSQSGIDVTNYRGGNNIQSMSESRGLMPSSYLNCSMSKEYAWIHVWIKVLKGRCTIRFKVGCVTGVNNQHSVKVDGIAHHMKDVCSFSENEIPLSGKCKANHGEINLARTIWWWIICRLTSFTKQSPCHSPFECWYKSAKWMFR